MLLERNYLHFMFHEMPTALPTSTRQVLTIIQREKEQRDIKYIKIVAYSEVSIDCCLKIENRKQGGCSFLQKEIYVETGAFMLRGFLHQSILLNHVFTSDLYHVLLIISVFVVNFCANIATLKIQFSFVFCQVIGRINIVLTNVFKLPCLSP